MTSKFRIEIRFNHYDDADKASVAEQIRRDGYHCASRLALTHPHAQYTVEVHEIIAESGPTAFTARVLDAWASDQPPQMLDAIEQRIAAILENPDQTREAAIAAVRALNVLDNSEDSDKADVARSILALACSKVWR